MVLKDSLEVEHPRFGLEHGMCVCGGGCLSRRSLGDCLNYCKTGKGEDRSV